MIKRFNILLLIGILGGLLSHSGPPISVLTPMVIWDSLLHIEQAPGLTQQQKLALVLPLRAAFEKGGFPHDSVYARLLHRIAVFEYYTTKAYDSCIANNLEAIRINTSGRAGACLSFAAGSYRNMGYYYKGLSIYDQALSYFDSAIQLANRFPGEQAVVKTCRQERSNIYSIKGDYEKCIEEATLGILLGEDTHDTAYSIILLYQRALAETKANDIAAAVGDIELGRQLALFTRDTVAVGNSLAIKAFIDGTIGHTQEALQEYHSVFRLLSGRPASISLADYYLDQGNLLMVKMNRLADAEASYHRAYALALQIRDPIEAASACIDLNALHHNKRNFRQAILDLHQALQQLHILPSKDILHNPSFEAMAAQQNKQLLVMAFANKTDDLLEFYKSTREPAMLSACVHTALLADSLITTLRHEQTDEPSKLAWRTNTREFYANALEASWLAHDANTAFFFMEKSRAVLLNDKLNELGASAFLPPDELARQRQLQLGLIQRERHLADLTDSSPDYPREERAFLQAKDSLERYTRTLEQKAPAYYQYKYADAVPSLQELQRLLAAGDRYFVHYFVSDSVIYMLGITSSGTQMIRKPYRNLGREIDGFLRFCADRQAENVDFPAFGSLAHHLYSVLFLPLGWKGGRVFVSPDNFFIPFEALATDSSGSHFLINDFSFDYVYSARYLLQAGHVAAGGAGFLGVAPAYFDAGLDVPDLPLSIDACREAAAYYPQSDVLTQRRATKKEFLQEAGHYSVVTVYAHARSDSVQSEPLLFLADSVIRLSELPLLQHPATQLVVLSACQTNAGRSEEGEGIYSLARGFAAAGVPAVAATLWQADEQSIYAITAAFHKRLAQGMDKDQALRESKLEFIRRSDRSRSLPYYWANMILVGNSDPLVLARARVFHWWWVADLVVVVLVGFWFWGKVRRGASR